MPARVHLETVRPRAAGGTVATAKDQPVVARAAEHLVSPIGAAQRAARAAKLREARNHVIALAARQNVRPGPAGQQVFPGLAGKTVIVIPAVQPVIAAAPKRKVGATAPGHAVIAVLRRDEIIARPHVGAVIAAAQIGKIRAVRGGQRVVAAFHEPREVVGIRRDLVIRVAKPVGAVIGLAVTKRILLRAGASAFLVVQGKAGAESPEKQQKIGNRCDVHRGTLRVTRHQSRLSQANMAPDGRKSALRPT